MSAEVKDMSSDIKSLEANKSKDSFTRISETMEGSLKVACIGLAGGLVIGYLKKYNLFYSAIIGMFAGGVVGSFFIKKSEQ